MLNPHCLLCLVIFHVSNEHISVIKYVLSKLAETTDTKGFFYQWNLKIKYYGRPTKFHFIAILRSILGVN